MQKSFYFWSILCSHQADRTGLFFMKVKGNPVWTKVVIWDKFFGLVRIAAFFIEKWPVWDGCFHFLFGMAELDNGSTKNVNFEVWKSPEVHLRTPLSSWQCSISAGGKTLCSLLRRFIILCAMRAPVIVKTDISVYPIKNRQALIAQTQAASRLRRHRHSSRLNKPLL